VGRASDVPARNDRIRKPYLNKTKKEIKMSEEKKKNLFDKAIDALTDRDEKEAAAAQAKALADAAKKEADARAKIAAEKAATEKAAAEKAAAEKAAAEKVAAVKAEADKRAAEQMAAMKAANEKAAAERAASAAAPKKGVVTVRSLRIRADHNTTSEVVAGLVDGDEVSVLSTWSDGKNTWAKLDKGWAAMVYDGETYIKLA
jgi:ATPase subunit of ABC transporter with duplicated ATPase domains